VSADARGFSGQDLRERGSGEICLREEAASATARDHAGEVTAIVDRREHHRRGIGIAGETQRNLESVEVRELYVEQNDRRAQLSSRGER